MRSFKEQLAETLKTHICDLPDTSEHERRLRDITKEYLTKMDLGDLADYHKALGDVKRLSILKLLCFREMCVCELTAALDMSQPNLTHHIKKLAAAGLVEHERRGKFVYYSLGKKRA